MIMGKFADALYFKILAKLRFVFFISSINFIRQQSKQSLAYL